MESPDQPKKPYSSPTLTKMTRKQAKEFVMDRKHCSEDEADNFLDLLRQQAQRTSRDQERKRCA